MLFAGAPAGSRDPLGLGLWPKVSHLPGPCASSGSPRRFRPVLASDPFAASGRVTVLRCTGEDNFSP
jgi:hypothetical protein